MERVCGFVGHLEVTDQNEPATEQTLTAWTERMSESVNRWVDAADGGHGLEISATLICMNWLNWTRVLLEDGDATKRDELLRAGGRWIAVYQNLPRTSR